MGRSRLLMASASGWSMALTCWDMTDSVLVFVS